VAPAIAAAFVPYQPPASMVNSDKNALVKVDPAALRKANLSMKLSDGYMPSEKLAGTDTLGTVFQAASALPAISAEYDLMGMFVYSMALQGATWMKSFKRTPEQSQAYIQQMAAASQAAGTANPPPPAQQQPGEPG
jgi:hypothetical protein